MSDPLEALKRALEQGDIMVPAGDTDIARMAMIHALRAQSDVLERIAALQDKQDGALKEAVEALHSIDKRLTVIESNSLDREVSDMKGRMAKAESRITKIEHSLIDNGEARMKLIERDLAVREGIGAAARLVKDYGPLIIGILGAVFVVLVASGRIVF